MRLVPLRSVASIQLGKMLSPKAKTGKTPVPYLRNQDVQWGRIAVRELATMDFSADEREKFELRAGDLLVCEGGEPGRCAVWQSELAGCYYQKALHRVRPIVGVADSEFLSLWIRHLAFTGAFQDQNSKTTIAHLPLVRLAEMPVPALSIDEQKEYSRRLNAEFAAVAGAQVAAEAQLSDAKRLTAAILTAAFLHLENVSVAKIAAVARTSSGTTPSRDRKDYWAPAKYPWVKTGEVAFTPIRRTEESVSERALDECSLPLLPPGTVLVAMYGQGKTRGQSAVLEVAATTNQACFAILPCDRLDPEFLQLWLRYSYEALRALSDARGGNQSNLNGAILNDFEVPVLPMDRQRSIVNQVREALDHAAALQRALESQLSEIALLPKQLLAGAFETTEEPTHA